MTRMASARAWMNASWSRLPTDRPTSRTEIVGSTRVGGRKFLFLPFRFREPKSWPMQ